jgi:hypothetical protein
VFHFSAVEFRHYFEHVKALGFDDRPDYEHLKKLFRDLFVRKGYSYDNIFDWDLLPRNHTAMGVVPPNTDTRYLMETSAGQRRGHHGNGHGDDGEGELAEMEKERIVEDRGRIEERRERTRGEERERSQNNRLLPGIDPFSGKLTNASSQQPLLHHHSSSSLLPTRDIATANIDQIGPGKRFLFLSGFLAFNRFLFSANLYGVEFSHSLSYGGQTTSQNNVFHVNGPPPIFHPRAAVPSQPQQQYSANMRRPSNT